LELKSEIGIYSIFGEGKKKVLIQYNTRKYRHYYKMQKKIKIKIKKIRYNR